MEQLIGNYSNTVVFETEVYPGVFWVPVNTLGTSRYTNAQMAEIAVLSPSHKKIHIRNLYEAIQLFQVSGFQGVFDNINHWIDGKLWQVHKSPEDAILSNEGCCATDTNWLAYFIQDHYDKVGSFCYANADGNGHITTYIRHNDDWYFIDMMMCRADSQSCFGKENGLLPELLCAEWSGFLYKSKEPIDFCKYCINRFQAHNRDVPFCFYLRETPLVSATGLCKNEQGVTFYIPNHEKPRIVWRDVEPSKNVVFVDLPKFDCM